jgi:hypothetical protein
MYQSDEDVAMAEIEGLDRLGREGRLSNDAAENSRRIAAAEHAQKDRDHVAESGRQHRLQAAMEAEIAELYAGIASGVVKRSTRVSINGLGGQDLASAIRAKYRAQGLLSELPEGYSTSVNEPAPADEGALRTAFVNELLAIVRRGGSGLEQLVETRDRFRKMGLLDLSVPTDLRSQARHS